jgi:ribosomal protein S18 acetylase RimI-like enzyme
VTLIEWGSLPAETLAPLYRREEACWRAALSWDTAASWATVETARSTWGLPGVVCTDSSGNVCGWTFFMRRGDLVEVGGLVADSHDVTEMLLESLLVQSNGRLGGFVYATAPGLQEACIARGISTARYQYLARATNRVPYDRATASFRQWRRHDADKTATLLKDAYGSSGRLFARGNTLQEWRTYVDNLVSYSGCGVLHPELSRVVETNGHIAALALVTALASDTVHLAQLAVSPDLRRSGLARTLIAETLKSAHAAEYHQMSLLVSTENVAGGCLYRRLGFAERGTFLAFIAA